MIIKNNSGKSAAERQLIWRVCGRNKKKMVLSGRDVCVRLQRATAITTAH